MSKLIFAIFNDEDVLMKSIKPLRSKGINITNVYTPCPVHGLDHELGLGRTWISVTSFIYGCIGGSLAILMTWYMMVHDWPMDIGGKPNFFYYKNLPAFVPVIFESTVLCACHGMAITFFLRSKTLPGITAFVPDKRITDDRFVMQVELEDASTEAQVADVLKQHGAEEVKEYGK